MYERSVTERRRLPHRHESVVTTLVKSTAMALGMSSLLWGGAAFGDVPDEVEIDQIGWGGPGCPGSVVPSVARDHEAFSLEFSAEYTVSVGPGIPITENRKNCNLMLGLRFPAGWSFIISKLDYRGFANLDPNVTLMLHSTYIWPVTTLTGPFAGKFVIGETFGLREWSPCGVNRVRLNIGTSAHMSNQENKNGFGIMTTKLGVPYLTYGMKWRRC